MRLRHGKAGHDVAVEQRLQVALLLPGCAVQRQDFGIPGVGSGAAEDGRRPRATSEDFVHERELELPEPFAAELGRKMAGPQSLPLHLLAQGRYEGARLLILRVVHRPGAREQEIERLDFLAHEVGHPIELYLKIRIDSEIHMCNAPGRRLS